MTVKMKKRKILDNWTRTWSISGCNNLSPDNPTFFCANNGYTLVKDSGNIWCQRVSRVPATVSDVIHLQDRFDDELLRQGAREMGLCEARRSLYDQLFDELIRQEVVACPVKGRLLEKIRRELAESMKSLLCCYESSLAYGIRKKLLSLVEKNKLTSEVTQLLSKISEMNETIENLEPEAAEAKETMEVLELEIYKDFAAYKEEITEENENLLAQLEECINISLPDEAVES